LGEGLLGNFILLECSGELMLNGLGPLKVVRLIRPGLAGLREGPIEK